MILRNLAAALLILSWGAAPVLAAPVKDKTALEMQDMTEKKPKRERSEAQKKNDQIMRDCGADWRSKKDELSKKGTKWRDFLKECRAKKKKS